MHTTKAPVIFIIYNRPDLTDFVLRSISSYQPDKLYVVADGPKNEQDKLLCDQTRDLIEQIQWGCKIYKNYADENMGCGRRVSSGITWAFETCDRAIILEDDCVPDSSFFAYCEELLEKYKDNERIGSIGGTQFLDNLNIRHSYYFSNFEVVWGWATWKRVWEKYDFPIKDWPLYGNLTWLIRKSTSYAFAVERKKANDRVFNGKVDSWAYQLAFMLWKNNQLSIRPKTNLVSNIGFDYRATHTKNSSDKFASLSITPMPFPLRHPKLVHRHLINDANEARERSNPSNRLHRKVLAKGNTFLRILYQKLNK